MTGFYPALRETFWLFILVGVLGGLALIVLGAATRFGRVRLGERAAGWLGRLAVGAGAAWIIWMGVLLSQDTPEAVMPAFLFLSTLLLVPVSQSRARGFVIWSGAAAVVLAAFCLVWGFSIGILAAPATLAIVLGGGLALATRRAPATP
jgi:hypothetical protein